MQTRYTFINELISGCKDDDAEAAPEENDADSEAANMIDLPCSFGTCICAAEGLKLFPFRNSLFRAFKAEFNRGEVEKRVLLQKQQIFFKLEALPPGVESGSNLAEFWGVKPFWWHVSKCMYTPYVLVFQQATDVSDTDLAGQANSYGDELTMLCPG